MTQFNRFNRFFKSEGRTVIVQPLCKLNMKPLKSNNTEIKGFHTQDYDGSFECLDFSESNIIDSTFLGKSFKYCDFKGVLIQNSSMTHVFFKGVDLRGSKIYNAVFDNADLSKSIINDCFIEKVSFISIKAEDALFKDNTIKKCDFSNAFLVDADFRGSVLSGVNFRNANLRGVSFRNTYLNHVDFEGADISDVDFRGAKFNKCNALDMKKEGVIY